MEIKTRAYVLRATDYKENDKLLTLFSLEHGKLTAAIKGVKKPKAKFKFAAQPFALIEFVLAERGGFYTVTGAQAVDSFFEISQDVEKFYAVSVMAQALSQTLQEKQADVPAFTAFGHVLGALSYERTDTKLLLTHFLCNLLFGEGVFSAFSHCRLCDKPLRKAYFSLAEGGCFCEEHRRLDAVLLKEEVHNLLCAVEGTDLTRLIGKRCGVSAARGALRLLSDDLKEREEISLPTLNDYIDLFLREEDGNYGYPIRDF